MNRRILFGLIAATAFLAGCDDNIWTAVAKDCAVSDIDSKKMLYFGPSNTLGPGSIWREAPENAGGGYRVRWDSTAVPGVSNWSRDGAEFACQNATRRRLTGQAAATFASQLSPLSAEASADFARAKSAEVKASMMKWDLLLEGPYEQAVIGMPPGSQVQEDLRRPGRLVLYRALKVRGFEAKMTFDDAVGAQLQGKYSGPAIKALNGELGAGLNFRWTNAGELIITSPGDFYVAGELVPFDSGAGFASTTVARSAPVDIKSPALVTSEKQN